MLSVVAIVVLLSAALCAFENNIPHKIPFRKEKDYHTTKSLTNDQIASLADLTNITHINEVLDNICIVRVVGTPQHSKVKEYIKTTMRDLNWTVESDVFTDDTPIFGNLTFENIIARLNPNARRYLTLACHYDSKYFIEGNFVGATDSAVPCAQMLNLATVMKDQLQSVQDRDISLMFIFFDGEEAFRSWNPKDSIYGARHLAKTWHTVSNTYGDENITHLDKMDLLVLLDLIGASDPKFYNYFMNTHTWYNKLEKIETKLANENRLTDYSYGNSLRTYFQPYSRNLGIEDDHIPFLEKNVPILHIIPYPFPKFWHLPEDNCNNIDLNTIENLNKILRIFVAMYLHINVKEYQ